MPSQATPLAFVPVASSATPSRGASNGQAAEGFDALVEETKREKAARDAATNPETVEAADAQSQPTTEGAEALIAEAPVEATARPATGSVFDALNGTLVGPTDGQAVGTDITEGQSAIDPKVAALQAQIATAQSDKAPSGDNVRGVAAPATPQPAVDAQVDADTVAVSAGTAQAEPDVALTARESRVAETLLRLNDAATKPQAAPKSDTSAAQVDVKLQDSSPKDAELSAKAETVTSDGEAADTDILAPLKEGRTASERAPGELLRGDVRASRADGPSTGPDAKPGAGEAKSAVTGATPTDAKPSPQAAPQATPTANSSQTPNPSAPLPPLELLLGQMTGVMASEPMPIEDGEVYALSRGAPSTDLAMSQFEARSEIRTASTLQFAQGPRLTPQGAQTMAAQIAQRFNEGSKVFDIRMDPPELGRVEVRLEVGKDNSVRAILAAERIETLAELQRSARELERALAEAGLNVGEDALTFSLTDDNAFSEDASDDAAPDTPVFVNAEADLDALAAPIGPISTYGFLLNRAEGLDVSV